LEEAVVRRELSDNFCFYEPLYDKLEACADWAKDSLHKHATDKREYIYTWYTL
jgi:deoxyribodipyrimidine photo-lyase